MFMFCLHELWLWNSPNTLINQSATAIALVSYHNRWSDWSSRRRTRNTSTPLRRPADHSHFIAMTSEKQRRSGAKAKRKILPPAPIIILYLIARLSSSAFVASAQYVRRQGDHRGPGLPERDWGQVSARRDVSLSPSPLSAPPASNVWLTEAI